ncbi:MAG: transporter [Sporolactobacillus sp.]
MKKSLQVLQIAATYIGTIVGAGFASGKEVVQFFTMYQVWGTPAIVVSTVLMAWVSAKMMIYARHLRAYSLNELLVNVFGTAIGRPLQCLLFLIIFVMTGVMLSGAGALFSEQLSLSRQAGMLLVIGLSVFFLIRGLHGLLLVNSLVVPCLFLLITFSFVAHAGTLNVSLPLMWHTPSLFSALRYASFNVLTALVVLVPVARETGDERVLRAGSWLGGLGFGVLLLMAHLLLLAHPELLSRDMPMADIVRPFGDVMHLYFVLIIFGEILTTFVGNVFGLSRQLQSMSSGRLRFSQSVLLLTAAAYIIGQFQYGSLIETLYPLFGTFCSALFLCFCLLRVR